MCEIFGAYGWGEGVRLEKYLTDHFLVRGINHYVPHAFTAKAFPDPDCPPHFYAHGHNPQYRHFGALMAYMNRVCELISDGVHVAPVAVLYHGEGEWMGKAMYSHKVAHVLADAQIDYDFIPQDVFSETEKYRTRLSDGCLKVNTQVYRALIVPAMPFVTPEFAAYVETMKAAGVSVWFIDNCPDGLTGTVMGLEDVVPSVCGHYFRDVTLCPANNRIRYYHYIHEDQTEVYLIVNEGTQAYTGTIYVKNTGTAYGYNAWDNCPEPVEVKTDGEGTEIALTVEPLKPQIVIFDGGVSGETDAGVSGKSAAGMEILKKYMRVPVKAEGMSVEFNGPWQRSICRSIDYPLFDGQKAVTLPDALAAEEPEFSGFARYENNFNCEKGRHAVLKITDAHEGVEVFVNGQSLGIQIAPPFVYDLSDALMDGENSIVIEVATTLEREMAKVPNMFGMTAEAQALSGITGDVTVYSS